MKAWGYGAGYQHAHLAEDALTDMDCLPDALAGKRYYQPTLRGMEQKIHERLEQIRKKRERKD
jgi:putative ATPase